MVEKISALVVCVVVVAVVFGGFLFFVGRNQEKVRVELEYTQQLEEEQRVREEGQRAQKEEQRKREESWWSQQTKPLNGMTKSQVRRIWGKPVEKVYQPQTTEGWFYGSRYNDGDAVDKFVWFKYGKVYIVVTTTEAVRERRIDDRHIRIGDETLAAFARGDMYAWKRFQTLFIGFSKNEHIREMSNGEFEELIERLISEEDPRVKHEREAVKHELEAVNREREVVEFEAAKHRAIREAAFKQLAQEARFKQQEREWRQSPAAGAYQRHRRRRADVTNITNQFRSSGMMPSGY